MRTAEYRKTWVFIVFFPNNDDQFIINYTIIKSHITLQGNSYYIWNRKYVVTMGLGGDQHTSLLYQYCEFVSPHKCLSKNVYSRIQKCLSSYVISKYTQRFRPEKQVQFISIWLANIQLRDLNCIQYRYSFIDTGSKYNLRHIVVCTQGMLIIPFKCLD